MSEKKTPKKEKFNEIKNVLLDAGYEDLATVMEHEIELLEKKAATAKASAAKKKKANDALSDAVAAVLTDELQPIADITALVDAEDVTISKVQYRLNALVANGVARKEQISVKVGDDEKTRKCMAYALAVTEDAE